MKSCFLSAEKQDMAAETLGLSMALAESFLKPTMRGGGGGGGGEDCDCCPVSYDDDAIHRAPAEPPRAPAEPARRPSPPPPKRYLRQRKPSKFESATHHIAKHPIRHIIFLTILISLAFFGYFWSEVMKLIVELSKNKDLTGLLAEANCEKNVQYCIC